MINKNNQKSQTQNLPTRSSMRQIAAYALLVLGGKPAPAPEEVAQVVREAGVDPDMEKCIALCAALEGKPFNELVNKGLQTLKAMEPAAQEKMAQETMIQMPAYDEEEENDGTCCGQCAFCANDY